MKVNGKMIVDPIPFDKPLLGLALNLKESGLPWSPQTGCFVWDPHGHITVPSPFPHRVYFILSISRFLDIFGDVEQMQDKLVWLPTYYQAMHVCIQMGVPKTTITLANPMEPYFSPVHGLMRLYHAIEKKLRKAATKNTSDAPSPDANNSNQWILRVMEAELGNLSHLPDAVRHRIESVVRDVSMAYLGWRRIQEHKGNEWVPPENRFEPTLLRELGHFFSDYQHLIKMFEMTRRTLTLFRSIDPLKDPEAYSQLTTLLVNKGGTSESPDRIMEQLTAPIETQAQHQSKVPGN